MQCAQCPDYFDAEGWKCTDQCLWRFFDRERKCVQCSSQGELRYQSGLCGSVTESFDCVAQQVGVWFECTDSCALVDGQYCVAKCEKMNTFVLNGQCVQWCEAYQVINSGKFCIGSCPSKFIMQRSSKQCVQYCAVQSGDECLPSCLQAPDAGKCVDYTLEKCESAIGVRGCEKNCQSEMQHVCIPAVHCDVGLTIHG